jgi:putative exosortase-associated protein (TIGR04073 family)
MRNTISLLAVLVVAGFLSSGCQNVERKFGRGMNNTFEIVRGGEFRRSIEQTALFESADSAYGYGFVHGVNRTLARTGIGIYEIVTAPFPPYGPVFTDHFAPGPVRPDNFNPSFVAGTMSATDTYIGFSGGSVAPYVPANRFQIFDTH